MKDFKINKFISQLKKYYNIVKADKQLFDEIADYFVKDIRQAGVLSKNQPELINLIFMKRINDANTDSKLLQEFSLLRIWGSILSENSIREYVKKLLNFLKEMEANKDETKGYSNHYYNILNTLQELTKMHNVKSSINIPLLEKILSYHSPDRLPIFDPKSNKKMFHATDIIAMLKGGGIGNYTRFDNLTFPTLLEVMNKSTSQAQDILRSVLWVRYGGLTGHKSLFIIDSENKAINNEMQSVDVYGKIMPMSKTQWNEFDADDTKERNKWLQIFSDFNIVPYIEF